MLLVSQVGHNLPQKLVAQAHVSQQNVPLNLLGGFLCRIMRCLCHPTGLDDLPNCNDKTNYGEQERYRSSKCPWASPICFYHMR